MKYAISTLLVILALSGCATSANPQLTMDNLNQRFDGHNVDEFFIAYGMPADEHQLNMGGKLYRWLSSVKQYEVPGPVFYSGYGYGSGYGYYGGFVNTFPSETIKQYCELQIQTDRAGIIQRLVRINDTMGESSTSRCSELFDAPIMHSNK